MVGPVGVVRGRLRASRLTAPAADPQRRVFDLVDAQHAQLAAGATVVSESQYKVNQLRKALHELQMSVEHPRDGALPRLRQSTIEYQASASRLKACGEVVGVLEKLVAVDELLSAFEGHLAGGELVAAAGDVQQMRGDLAPVREVRGRRSVPFPAPLT